MPTKVLMPALSPHNGEGNLSKWLKKEGDTVKSGDVIAEIETDKATMEVEAVDEGKLGKILVPEGTADVAVNTPDRHDPRRRRRRSLPQGRQTGNRPSQPAAEAKQAEPKTERRSPRPRAHGPKPMARQGAPPAQAAAPAAPEPEGPEAPSLSPWTMREALRDAMAEEMRRDPDVFVMGEEVAEYQGA